MLNGNIPDKSWSRLRNTILREYKSTLKKVYQSREANYKGQRVDFKPLTIFGPVGVGKSMIIESIARELGVAFRSITLANLSEADLVGLPVVDDEYELDKKTGQKVTTYTRNNKLPTGKEHRNQNGELDDGPNGILLLDECTTASPAVQRTLNSLLDSNRGYGDHYTLPIGWKVILAGNGPEDGGTYMAFDFAKATRGPIYHVKAEFGEWKPWALKNNISPYILAFLSQDESALYRAPDDMAEAEMGYCFPNPRTWANFALAIDDEDLDLSRVYSSNTAKCKEDREFLEDTAEGNLGGPMAATFCAYIKCSQNLMNVEEILSGEYKNKKDAFANMTTEGAYITGQNLVRTLTTILNDSISSESEDLFMPNFDAATEAKVINVCDWLARFSKKSTMGTAEGMNKVFSTPKTSNGKDVAVMILRDLSESVPHFDDVMLSLTMKRENDAEMKAFDELLQDACNLKGM